MKKLIDNAIFGLAIGALLYIGYIVWFVQERM